jgi:predicted ABC-type ATPase
MTAEEIAIQQRALDFARANKKKIAKRRTSKDIFPPEQCPVSVFMAGSPGAGKTEASIALIESVDGPSVMRIDPDELREEFADYNGANAYLFQAATSVLVEKVLDLAIDQSQSFLLDGTLSRLDKARSNVERSLRRNRTVQILYVYQDPRLAWEFVQAREAQEGRRILPIHFVEQYFAARDVVNQLKVEFGRDIHVDLLIKNNDNTDRFYRNGVDKIDHHVPEKHSREDLERMLGLRGA